MLSIILAISIVIGLLFRSFHVFLFGLIGLLFFFYPVLTFAFTGIGGGIFYLFRRHHHARQSKHHIGSDRDDPNN